MSIKSASLIQEKIDSLQKELNLKIENAAIKYNLEIRKVMEERQKYINEQIAAGKLPANFWAKVVIALLTVTGADQSSPHFLGPYDVRLLEEYLDYVEVQFRTTEIKPEDAASGEEKKEGEVRGSRLLFHFKPNPFFEETTLWAEEDTELKEWEFSGITWKEGCGPQMDEEEEDHSGHDHSHGESCKRPREEGATADGATTTKGPSVMDLFSKMSPYPEDDEALDEEDLEDDEIAELCAEWEDEMDDREVLLGLFMQMVENPVNFLDAADEMAAEDEKDKEALKRAKPE